MKVIRSAAAVALFILPDCLMLGAPKLTPGNVAVGKNLQTFTTFTLSEAAAGDTVVTLTSSDPARLLLSKTPDLAGSSSIVLTVKARYVEAEFWLQALADVGEVKYTASAPGFDSGTGTATLTPSGIVVFGPFQAPWFITTPRGWPSRITVRSARLDSSLNYVEPQYVRSGFSLEIKLASSNPSAGSVSPSMVSIGAVADMAYAQFKPAAEGTTTIAASSPGASTPASSNSVIAKIRMPGIAIADDTIIGENLQVPAALNIGETAPEGGVSVTLTSGDPAKLLLSTAETEPGKSSITIKIPQGGVTAVYYLQSLGRSGTVTHTASAPGFVGRTGTLTLAPSGVIISLEQHGPPDEAELFRPESAGGTHNLFTAKLSRRQSTPLILFTAYMDPVTRRTADITVQSLRAGLTVPVELTNADPAVGTVASRVTIKGGSDRTVLGFTPLSTGKTLISVATPQGFTTPTNSTGLLAVVRE